VEKRKGLVTMKGSPVTLIGSPVKEGAPAPHFKALTKNLEGFQLKELKGQRILISVAPSLDTEVCDLQTMRFNEEAAALKDTAVLSISMDLPFALKRYCADRGIENAYVLSDHRDADFGLKYGFLMEEFRLLARGVVLIDAGGIVRYVEVVPEGSNQPDYDQALAKAKTIS